MTVDSTPARAQYATNGTTGPWSVPFRFLENDHLLVIYTDASGVDTELTVDVTFTATGAGTQNGGTVYTTTAYGFGGRITILLDVPIEQQSDYVNGDSLPAETLEQDLDQATMISKQLAELLGRAIVMPRGDASTSGELPAAALRADHVLTFDPVTGAPIISGFTATQLASAIAAAYAAGSSAAAVTFVGPDNNPLESRSIQDKARDIVSAKDFVLATDTSADQWINRALAYAGGLVKTIIPTKVDLVTASVYLPVGLWRSAATINVPEGVRLYGAGMAASVIWHNAIGIAVQVGDGTRELHAAGLADIGILGNYGGVLGTYGAWSSATTAGVLFNKCIRGCGLDRVMIAATQIGFKATGSFAWHLRDSYFVYTLTNFLYADNATASTASGNRFDWCEGTIGVLIDGTSAANETVGFHLDGGAIQLCWGSGIGLYDVTSASIADVHFEGNYRLAVDAATHTYADIDIATGANARGRDFTVQGCFFTPGTSPAVAAYTGIRCNKANVLNTRDNVVRDARYYRAVDVLSGPAAVGRLVGVGNDFTGAAGKYAYDATVTDVFIEEQDGAGVKTISKVRLGGLRLIASVGTGNQVTDGTKVDYYISTAGGSRGLLLRDTECVAGARIEVCKTSGDGNALSVGTVAADGVSASAKTINGLASVSTTTAYGGAILGSDGTNWFVKAKI